MDGDFESLMIWSTLDLQRAANSLATDSKMAPISLSPNDLLPDQLLRQHGLRSSDLAQVTGVPRETVRRKLERLQVNGKVRRDDDGRWHAVNLSRTPATRIFSNDTAKNFRTTIALLRSTSSG